MAGAAKPITFKFGGVTHFVYALWSNSNPQISATLDPKLWPAYLELVAEQSSDQGAKSLVLGSNSNDPDWPFLNA